jgi:hypothetical protein
MSDRDATCRPENAAGPRLRRLARGLLCSLGSFTKLTVLILTSVHMSSCVLPIAPEFQDPPAAANFPPMIIEGRPPLGSIVSQTHFEATITDPNLGDDLHVRWVVDYPPFSSSNTRTLEDQTISHPTNGQPLKQDVSIDIDCIIDVLAPIAQHQVMLIVADRDFPSPPPQNKLEVVPLPGYSVVGTWVLNLDCSTP